MPDLEFLVWKRRFSPILLYRFKRPVSPKQPDVTVTKLSRSVEVKPA
jgi:hypothetical protein